MPDIVSNASAILVIGAGELGMAVLYALATARSSVVNASNQKMKAARAAASADSFPGPRHARRPGVCHVNPRMSG